MEHGRPQTGVTTAVQITRLIDLAYELLDAHRDTIYLALDECEDLNWGSHLDYLRDLSRIGHECLAQLGVSEPDETTPMTQGQQSTS